MIQVYSPTNTDYTKNGDMTLLPEDAKVHAILGGMWEAALTHPIDDEGRWRYLVEEAVVKMPSFNGNQLFRIRKPQKSDAGVYCVMDPIFYDCRDDVFLTDVRPEKKNGQEALNILCSGTKYSGESDILTKSTAYYIYKNLLEAIAGDDENSFVNRWGGEPIYDNYKVVINARAGSDYNVEIRYGKNIPEDGMSVDLDMSEVVTRIYPKAYNGYEMSNHGYVDSPLKSKYVKLYARTITYDDVKMREDAMEGDEDEGITVCDTQAQLNAALRAKCQADFAAGIDKPLVTIEADLILLQNTEQYADIAKLESVSLGDTVHCYNNHLDFTTNARVMELTYDCIKKRVDTVTLGAYKQSYFDKLLQGISGIDALAARANSALNGDGTVMAEKIKGFLNGAMASLRAQYNIAEKQDVIAILFENLDKTSDLYGALAIGTQGWMISKKRNASDTDWVWTTAATAAGIVADTIVTGTLSDAAGDNYWNLNTGDFRLNSSVKMGDKNLSTVITDAASSAVTNYDTALTQQKVFNKLTNNGKNAGIYLSNGYLYINANYIATGTLADANNNVVFNLSTGTLTMKKGSINIGDGVFQVTTTGALTATNANLRGRMRSVSGNTFSEVYNGMFRAGYTNGSTDTIHGQLDASAQYQSGTNAVSLIAKVGFLVLGGKGTIWFTDQSGSGTAWGWVTSSGIHSKNGVNISSAKIPSSINSDGTVQEWYNCSIVDGIVK